ncbi:transmembrane protein 26-like [Patiria miniata]|uniref:Transmembrane protein 26 n=1 Tax=Patiria miniata TaxID=46514 RepID=A0A914BD97_PATMI|nr:transmembrane protein 26-like [Patiria miniata]
MILRKAVQASLVRVAFLFHGLAGIGILVYFTQSPLYFVMALGILLFMLELVTTLRYNEKGEWRWFIPAVLLYLVLVVPVVWITELGLLDFRVALNVTGSGSCPSRFIILDTVDEHCKHVFEDAVGGVTQKQLDKYNFGQTFSTLFQQSFMLILILGRWLLPKGGMTRDELSQLLLIYVAMAADMLEFSIETLRLSEIACEKLIYKAILAVWSWSLIQFSFGQTVAKQRSRRLISSVVDRQAGGPPVNCVTYLCGSEIWALLVDVILQDGPYLVIRTYLIIEYRITDTILIFFALKNLLLVIMQLYRFAVLIVDTGIESRKRLAADPEELGLSVLKALQEAGGGQRATNGRVSVTLEFSNEAVVVEPQPILEEEDSVNGENSVLKMSPEVLFHNFSQDLIWSGGGGGFTNTTIKK